VTLFQTSTRPLLDEVFIFETGEALDGYDDEEEEDNDEDEEEEEEDEDDEEGDTPLN